MGSPRQSSVPILSQTLFVSDRLQYQRLELADILYFEAHGGYVDIVSKLGQSYRVSTNLSNVERQVDTTAFFRISRKHIINLAHLEIVGRNVVKVGSQELPITRLSRSELIAKLPMIYTGVAEERDSFEDSLA